MEETTRSFTIKDLLIRLILIIIFIFLLIWLFPMPDLKPLNNQIFADNLDRMKGAAKSYYTVERLPDDINESKKMTLKEMIDKKLILPLMDSNGKYCSEDDSYVQITKLENEYVIKIYLSCSDKQDYIIEHYGCYDICTEECKMLETTTTTTKKNGTTKKNSTTLNKTTTIKKVTTTNNSGKIYEYQFVKNVCSEKFDRYVCPTGYTLIGESCVKKGSKVVRTDAKKNVDYVISTDTKDAKPVTTTTNKTVGAIATTVTQKVTANKVTSKDVKGAVATTVTTNANYIKIQNYSVITATKYATTKWTYDYTTISSKGNLAYVKDNEKLVYVDEWAEPTCNTCFTYTVKYKYYHYVKNTTYSYSCENFDGYSLYDGNKCRKATTVTTKCPEGFDPNGSVCSKKNTTYSCSSYGSDYVYDESKKTCTKTSTTYNCDGIGEKTNDPKYCTKKQTTYECPTGTEKTSDKTKCNQKITNTTYSCKDYSGYSLLGNKCTKSIKTEKITYSCNDGEVLDGKTCIKTVNTSDTKSAEKKYKTVCENYYIWSTSTSLDGWTYTGNKRQIN